MVLESLKFVFILLQLKIYLFAVTPQLMLRCQVKYLKQDSNNNSLKDEGLLCEGLRKFHK